MLKKKLFGSGFSDFLPQGKSASVNTVGEVFGFLFAFCLFGVFWSFFYCYLFSEDGTKTRRIIPCKPLNKEQIVMISGLHLPFQRWMPLVTRHQHPFLSQNIIYVSHLGRGQNKIQSPFHIWQISVWRDLIVTTVHESLSVAIYHNKSTAINKKLVLKGHYKSLQLLIVNELLSLQLHKAKI